MILVNFIESDGYGGSGGFGFELDLYAGFFTTRTLLRKFITRPSE